MIRIANAQFWVHDQDEALRFYTRTLGWEVRADVTMEAWNFRWSARHHTGRAPYLAAARVGTTAPSDFA